MRTRSTRPPMLTRGIIRSVWLLKAAPSPGAGAAVQVPTQCMVFVAIDASLSGAMLRGIPVREVRHGGVPDAHPRRAAGRRSSSPCPDSFCLEPDLLVGRRPGIRVDQEQRRLGHAGADAAGPDEFVER